MSLATLAAAAAAASLPAPSSLQSQTSGPSIAHHSYSKPTTTMLSSPTDTPHMPHESFIRAGIKEEYGADENRPDTKLEESLDHPSAKAVPFASSTTSASASPEPPHHTGYFAGAPEERQPSPEKDSVSPLHASSLTSNAVATTVLKKVRQTPPKHIPMTPSYLSLRRSQSYSSLTAETPTSEDDYGNTASDSGSAFLKNSNGGTDKLAHKRRMNAGMWTSPKLW